MAVSAVVAMELNLPKCHLTLVMTLVSRNKKHSHCETKTLLTFHKYGSSVITPPAPRQPTPQHGGSVFVDLCFGKLNTLAHFPFRSVSTLEFYLTKIKRWQARQTSASPCTARFDCHYNKVRGRARLFSVFSQFVWQPYAFTTLHHECPRTQSFAHLPFK